MALAQWHGPRQMQMALLQGQQGQQQQRQQQLRRPQQPMALGRLRQMVLLQEEVGAGQRGWTQQQEAQQVAASSANRSRLRSSCQSDPQHQQHRCQQQR